MIILDTHTLVWMDEGSTRLGQKARRLIDKELRNEEVCRLHHQFLGNRHVDTKKNGFPLQRQSHNGCKTCWNKACIPVEIVNNELMALLVQHHENASTYLGKIYGTDVDLPMWFKHFVRDENLPALGAKDACHIGVFGKTGSGERMFTRHSSIQATAENFPSCSLDRSRLFQQQVLHCSLRFTSVTRTTVTRTNTSSPRREQAKKQKRSK